MDYTAQGHMRTEAQWGYEFVTTFAHLDAQGIDTNWVRVPCGAAPAHVRSLPAGAGTPRAHP